MSPTHSERERRTLAASAGTITDRPARAADGHGTLVRLAWAVLAVNLAVILWGAFVRATGSGAGCGAHWPLCNGEVLPRAPQIETLIELTHRVTSGLALALVLYLAWRAFRARPRGHPLRGAAAASVLLILAEAALGAGLVLFRLVAENESVARALFMSAHLVNTFLLLASLTLVAHFASADARPALAPAASCPFAAAALALLLVGASGAVAALGDTLYPARSLLGGLAADVSPTARLLVRLRLAHPVLAFAGSLAMALAASRVLRTPSSTSARRAARAAVLLVLAQLGVGLLNVALLAPVWMQLVHLLLADLVWIACVLMAVRHLTPASEADAEAAGTVAHAA